MKFLTLILLTLITTSAHANLFLRSCYDNTRTTGVSYSYQSCINSNFTAIKREIDIRNFHCSNLGNRATYSFTSCIERNFQSVEDNMDVRLDYCTNFDRDKLSYSYQICIRRNFTKIERVLKEQ